MHAFVVAALLLAGVMPSTAAADGHAHARERQQELHRQQSDAAAEIDVMQASQAQVTAALDRLEANLVAAQASLADADQHAVAAEREAAVTRTEELRVEDAVGTLRARLRDLAIGEFVSGAKGSEAAALLLDSDLGQLGRVRYLAGVEVAREDQVAAELERRRDELTSLRRSAEAARRRAGSQRQQAADRLAEVERARDEQARFVAEAEAALERRLAEAAALEQLDQELSAEIVRGEQALAARLAAEAARGAAAGRTGGTTATPRGPVPAGSLVTVRGIVVHASIADNLAALLDAAAADGVVLAGGGYRDAARQQRLREAHCPDPARSPASSCRPPTARTGHSMHEQGLAVDFTYEGRTIPSRSSPGYQWLAANAGRFGLRNLPSEPWHWSTDGT